MEAVAFRITGPRRSARSVLKGRIASTLCAIPAFYCLLVFSFALFHARHYASALPQLLRYVVVPGSMLVLFAGCAIYGSRTTRIAVGATSLAVLLALFAFEIKLQASAYSAVAGLVEVPNFAVLEAEGVTHGLPPAGTPQKLTHLLAMTTLADGVLSGMPQERTLLCGERGHPVIYRTDRFGFRNPDTTYARPVSTMFLGDSFVEGICLPDGRDLVGQFRSRHPGTVGIGSRGAGPLLELAMLGRFGPVIRPSRVVIVFYEGNDWENLDHELRRSWLVPALQDNAKFGPAIMPANTIARAQPILRQWFTSRSPGMMGVIRGAHIPRNLFALHQTWTQLGLGYPKAASEFPEYTRILVRSKAIAAAWGGKVVLAYVPQTSRLIGLFPDQFVFDQVRNKVRAAARRSGIPMIDLTPVFLRQPRPITFYAADGHLSGSGAALAARSIDAAIMTGKAS